MAKLQCPKCKSENIKVYSTRQKPESINRYRKCLDYVHYEKQSDNDKCKEKASMGPPRFV